VITKLQWSHERLNYVANFTKPKKNNKYFWVFKFKHKNKRNSKQSKIFLDFSEYEAENRRQRKPKTRKLKRQTKRNNGNIFGLFVCWKAEIRTRTTKKKKQNMDIQSTDKI
jgi:hypothetical protein